MFVHIPVAELRQYDTVNVTKHYQGLVIAYEALLTDFKVKLFGKGNFLIQSHEIIGLGG